jgi:hypothetical protein
MLRPGHCQPFALGLPPPSDQNLIDNREPHDHNVGLFLDEFEYLLLAASAGLGKEAYGVTIRLEIENETGRSCSVDALYTTLDRLESRGLIKPGWAM